MKPNSESVVKVCASSWRAIFRKLACSHAMTACWLQISHRVRGVRHHAMPTSRMLWRPVPEHVTAMRGPWGCAELVPRHLRRVPLAVGGELGRLRQPQGVGSAQRRPGPCQSKLTHRDLHMMEFVSSRGGARSLSMPRSGPAPPGSEHAPLHAGSHIRDCFFPAGGPGSRKMPSDMRQFTHGASVVFS